MLSTKVDTVLGLSAISLSKSFSLNDNIEMRRLVEVVFFFLLTSTFALSLPPSISIPPNAINILKPLNTAFRNLTAGRPFCGSRYGTSLSEYSCQNAWLKINRHSVIPESFRSRPTSSEIPLPVRILSDDGMCAIDIVNTEGVPGDISTGMEIAQQAKLLIDRCVREEHKGGFIDYFSTCSLHCTIFESH